MLSTDLQQHETALPNIPNFWGWIYDSFFFIEHCSPPLLKYHISCLNQCPFSGTSSLSIPYTAILTSNSCTCTSLLSHPIIQIIDLNLSLCIAPHHHVNILLCIMFLTCCSLSCSTFGSIKHGSSYSHFIKNFVLIFLLFCTHSVLQKNSTFTLVLML